jgi:hypothetical protein
MRNVGTFDVDANGKATDGLNHKGERTDATSAGGAPRSSEEVRENGRSEGGAWSEAKFVGPTRNGRSPRMVHLLRAIQPFGATACREACRPIVGSLGWSEIQEAARLSHASLGLAGTPY